MASQRSRFDVAVRSTSHNHQSPRSNTGPGTFPEHQLHRHKQMSHPEKHFTIPVLFLPFPGISPESVAPGGETSRSSAGHILTQ